ncbi:Ras GTPase-activating-like protein rng2 [Grifola frondosa]|uniref:Ras GTPase-activating-like protein rng2 n=1 Tax=Grifola frondosa TaxID=5627 RepID=A0A1C7M5Q5_GRIFR|nr:Ras GTPase-activating-like protein rng2 [Grifola frondosa]
MEHSDSSSARPRLNSASATGQFAYQRALLERTSSSPAGSVSRAGSQSRNSILSSPTGNGTATPNATRRWTPSHRVGGSLDINAVRGKWEDRTRAEGALDNRPLSTDSAEDRTRSDLSSVANTPRSPADVFTRTRSIRTTLPSPSLTETADRQHATPVALKRRTLPAPIIASPLSPNTTGVSIESPSSPAFSSFPSPTPQRIHLPVSAPLQSSSIAAVRSLGTYAQASDPAELIGSTRLRRSNTLDSINPASTGSSISSEGSSLSSGTSHTSRGLTPDPSPVPAPKRRPTSLYEVQLSTPSSDKYVRPLSSISSARASSTSADKRPTSSSTPATTSSVMSPSPYRSSHMAKKRAAAYGDTLGTGQSVRRLERIASGDAPEDWEDEAKAKDEPIPSPETPTRREERTMRVREWVAPEPELPRDQGIVIPSVMNAGDVAGIPRRKRLTRDTTPGAPSPLPSSRLTRGLWADVQRHLIQAYEYLCHVGEAKQWIEGCLGEELSFGVVEMEEGLRNGVVLAKLVRVFQGEAAAPKLDFRHSDNINYFFTLFATLVCLRDLSSSLLILYEKKNIPKVIYCIHALSHLLARRGLAQRIGNLVGHLQFSDDQLQRTQKGLKDAGVPMPNFGNIGRELAREINEEPEEEPETEDERRDRLLLECEDSIIALQSVARAYLVRREQIAQRAKMRLAERYVPKVQAMCRAALVRRHLERERQQRVNLAPWVLALQARARGALLRREWRSHLRAVMSATKFVLKVQAQARGVLQRRRFLKLKSAMRSCKVSVVKFQSLARARIAQNTHKEVAKEFAIPIVMSNIVALQANARGALTRARLARRRMLLVRMEDSIVRLQAQARGVIVRRRVRSQMAKLENVTDVVVRIQAAVRTYLARKRLLILIRGLRKATPALISLQAIARASLARQQHKAMHKALSQVTIISSVGGFQALARAALSRTRHREQVKHLEFVEPDVVGFQAAARGALVRGDYIGWRDYLRRSHPQATILQALLRGVLQRRKFRERMQYYRSNLDKIVVIQSLFRAKETREQYRQLTLGTNVTVGTIKNFVHLLDDSEADFQEEIKVERLRQAVVKRIRENQLLENDVNELDVKIALVVQNAKSFEELVKARRSFGADSAAMHASRASVLAAHGDRSLLFYLLQTNGQYLTKLFAKASENDWEKNRRLVERVVLTLFGYGQARREEYLLLKFFQTAIHEETLAASTVQEIAHAHPTFMNVAVQYLRPKLTAYIRDALQGVIREVIDSDDLDLETDPCVIYRRRIDLEEMRSGTPNTKPRDIPFHEALHDPDTRVEYIHHLQRLQWWTEKFVQAIIQSIQKMPYSMRYMARETLRSVKDKFPDASTEACAACIARLVYYRYINPAIITPETFDIVSTTIDIASRKNLAQISKMLTQITSGSEFGDDNPSFIPVNDYVRKTISSISSWLIEVANVSDAETEFHAHEFLDATMQPRAIWISPNEVYSVHTLLSQHLAHLAPDREDTLRVILTELDGVPNIGSDELNEARDTAIELQLTNRFALVRGKVACMRLCTESNRPSDPGADEKTLWVQAKRAVLAILRVQPGKDLVDSLMQPVTDEHEHVWEDIIEEMEKDQFRQQRRMPSTSGAESSYRLEDIRSMTFHELKAHAISVLLALEMRQKITREDGFQGVLNAIAGDVRSKNRRRVQRLHEKESLEQSLKYLAERKKYFEEQIDSYHDYVESAMSTMQRGKGKRRFVIPFTQQYFHMRELQKAGKTPQFGSFKYSAQHFYKKGILLSIDQYSPRQFDKLDIVLSSNVAGIFSIEIFNHSLGIVNRVASADVKMEDLLQAQFEDRASLSLFNGLAKFNLNLLLWQINKKYVLALLLLDSFIDISVPDFTYDITRTVYNRFRHDLQ